MSDSKQELFVRFDRVFADFPQGDATKIIAAAQLPNGSDVTIVGLANRDAMSYGLTYRLFGKWVQHPRYGRQFAFDTFVLSQPLDQYGVIKYLMQAPGIGKAMADKLWQLYGAKAVEKLRTEPQVIAAQIPRLTPAAALAAAEWLEENSAQEMATVELYSLLNGRGFGPASIREALRRWGNAAASLIRINPYLVRLLPNCGFAKADKLWKQLGKPLGRLKRQSLCIAYAMESSNEGHTWFPGSLAKETLESNIDSASVKLKRAVELGVRGKVFELYRDQTGMPWLAEKHKAVAEFTVARKLKELLEADPAWPDALELDRMSPHQRAMMKAATQRAVGLFIGGPGSGKTTSVAYLIREIARIHGTAQIAVCAPTGRAAVRITEQMGRAGIPLKATTIHKLLGISFNPQTNGWRFAFNASDPLPFKFVIVEEPSMCDSSLLASLLAACEPGTQVLFVGDHNQLPPVGHGSPLRDMIQSNIIPRGELTEIWRNGGRIVQACKEIRETGTYTPGKAWQLPDENLIHVESRHPNQSYMLLDKLYDKLGAMGNYDPIWHFQIICPVNTKSPLSRVALNKYLQNKLNPATPSNSVKGNPFRVNDKIICRKNKWMPAEDPNAPEAQDGKLYVANGEIGEVVKVTQTFTVAEFRDPYRVIRIPRAIAEASAEENEKEDGEQRDGPADSAAKFELAYCISGHASQGGEWPLVATIIDDSPAASMVCSREWVTTVISRPKVAGVTIGRWRTAEEFMQRSVMQTRKTFLRELLVGGSFVEV